MTATVHSASFSWNLGAGTADTNNWNLHKNWNPANGPPIAADSAEFGAVGSVTPNLTANSSITAITFESTAQAYVIGGGFTLGIGSGGIINNSANLQTFNSSVSLDAPQTWNLASGGLTVNGTLSGSGSLEKIGGGTLTLTGVNSYSGGLTISGGTVLVSSDANLGNGSSTITFNGGTLRTAAGLTSARNVVLNPAGATIDGGGFDSTFSGVMSNSGTLTKIGAGTLTLSGNNNYTGNTIIGAGTLLANSSSALGNTAGIQLNGGALKLGVTPAFSTPPPVTFAGGALLANDQSATFGSLILTANSSIDLNSGTPPSVAITFSSASISGGATLTINGWSGAANRDKIFITGAAPQIFLSAVNFTGFSSGAQISGTELVPVPEPAAIAFVTALILSGAALWRRTR